MMKAISKILIISLGIIGVLALAAFLVIFVFKGERRQNVLIQTDKNEYQKGDTLRLKVENKLLGTICFSSCYPYYIQRKGEEWESYVYQECENADVANSCFSKDDIKAFELVLPLIKEGIHRIAVPVCESCGMGQSFNSDAWFYSNDFVVK